ncbi:hypothetical protein [Cesiribacter sp. SM1]|uniref:hypothetical protein n=1 Tax=Cesiribacter sp. SM1 TaxID=2861196 RepID=UPI001CD2108E|nr:hypothetical protein [Cesiribacter sp. SM1]
MLLMGLVSLKASGQDTTSVNRKRLWIGLEIPSTFAHPARGGYSLQPMVVLNLSRYATVWGAGGLMKITRDTLFKNLYDYSSQGWYVKGGAELNLNFKKEANSGFRLGGGLSLANFTEKGMLQYSYTSELFEGQRPGNRYTEELENQTWAAAFEFRQGLFADLGKVAFQLHLQQSILLHEPANPRHPAHAVPGMGGYMPRPFFSGIRNSIKARKIIPGAYFYLFYRLL